MGKDKDSDIKGLVESVDRLSAAIAELASQGCEAKGHNLIEVDDNATPGQVFWCSACKTVLEVKFNSSQRQLAVIEVGKVEVRKPA